MKRQPWDEAQDADTLMGFLYQCRVPRSVALQIHHSEKGWSPKGYSPEQMHRIQAFILAYLPETSSIEYRVYPD